MRFNFPCQHHYSKVKVPCVQDVIAIRDRSTRFQLYFSKAGLTPDKEFPDRGGVWKFLVLLLL